MFWPTSLSTGSIRLAIALFDPQSNVPRIPAPSPGCVDYYRTPDRGGQCKIGGTSPGLAVNLFASSAAAGAEKVSSPVSQISAVTEPGASLTSIKKPCSLA